MTDQEKPRKDVQGEVEDTEESYESLRSARNHLAAAVADFKQFIDEDFAKLAKGAVDRIDDSISSGINSAADAMIESLQELKEYLRKEKSK
jgi:hypothetical protein